MATKTAPSPKAKKPDDKKKLLITAIKKTINRNSVLPILESVLLTGETAIVSDLETSVVIPFKNGVNAAVPADKFIDCLEMMESPQFEMKETVTPVPVPEHFRLEGKIYAGTLVEAQTSYQTYLNRFTDEDEERPLAFEEWCDSIGPASYDEEFVAEQSPIVSYGLEVNEGKRRIKLAFDTADNFPIIPLIDKDYPVIGFLMDSDMKKLENALTFVSSDDLRPAMTGVYFGTKDDDGRSRIVSTDAHRMYFNTLSECMDKHFIMPAKTAKILLALGGEWVVSTENEFERDDNNEIVLKQPTVTELRDPVFFYVRETDQENGILPRKGLREDAMADYEMRAEWEKDYSFEDWIRYEGKYPKINPDEKEAVEVPDLTKEPAPIPIDFSNVCFTRSDGVKVVTRKIDAKFPDYKVVIPQDEPASVVIVNPEEFLKEIKNASKFANKSTNMVTLGVNGKMTIGAQDVDFAYEYTNELELAEIKHNSGEGFNIGFNGKFINDIVWKEKDGPVTIKLWSPTKCAIINDKYLVMPLMLNN